MTSDDNFTREEMKSTGNSNYVGGHVDVFFPRISLKDIWLLKGKTHNIGLVINIDVVYTATRAQKRNRNGAILVQSSSILPETNQLLIQRKFKSKRSIV